MHKMPTLLLLALMLAGCSWLVPGAPPAGGGAGNEPGGGADNPIVGGGGGQMSPIVNDGALRELPDPTIVDARQTAVDHSVLGADGRTLVIYYWGGTQACFGLHSVAVEPRDGFVLVTVSEGTRPAAIGMACTMEALLKSTVVTLDAPLVRDGSGAEPAPGEPQLAPQPQVVRQGVGVVDAISHAISGFVLAADGRSLLAHYVGGTAECYALADATAAAGPDGVLAITIREGRLANAGSCDDIGVAKAVSIILDAPLVMDGSQG